MSDYIMTYGRHTASLFCVPYFAISSHIPYISITFSSHLSAIIWKSIRFMIPAAYGLLLDGTCLMALAQTAPGGDRFYLQGGIENDKKSIQIVIGHFGHAALPERPAGLLVTSM